MSKLDPRATKNAFLGYGSNKPWYRCFDPTTKKMYTTMDTIFFEKRPYFSTHLQGENLSEDLVQIELDISNSGFDVSKLATTTTIPYSDSSMSKPNSIQNSRFYPRNNQTPFNTRNRPSY